MVASEWDSVRLKAEEVWVPGKIALPPEHPKPLKPIRIDPLKTKAPSFVHIPAFAFLFT
jgi:hypothetical protein